MSSGPSDPDAPERTQERPAQERPGLERPVLTLSRRTLMLAVHVVSALVLGVLAGVVWNLVVTLPAWRVGSGGTASTTERDLAGFFTTDFWFSVIGALAGLLLGAWAWWWFHHRGWIVVAIALLVPLAAGLVCWWVGEAMGPQGFEQRLAQASPGDLVPIDFRLEAWVALALWPLGAMLPVMVGSAFLPDPDDRALRRLRRRHAARARQVIAPDRAASPEGADGPQQ